MTNLSLEKDSLLYSSIKTLKDAEYYIGMYESDDTYRNEKELLRLMYSIKNVISSFLTWKGICINVPFRGDISLRSNFSNLGYSVQAANKINDAYNNYFLYTAIGVSFREELSYVKEFFRAVKEVFIDADYSVYSVYNQIDIGSYEFI